MPTGRFRRLTAAVATLSALALVTAACGGDDKENTSSGGGLEKTKITVRILENADAAPIFIAKNKGYFAAEGLEVETKVEQKGDVAIQGILGGTFDLGSVNYVSVLQGQAQGRKFRVVADNYQAKPNTFLIMTKKDSPIKSVKDLAGKRITVSTPNNIAQLMNLSTLEAAGVDTSGVTFPPVAFPDMVGALNSGKADAISTIEPFITQAEKQGLVTIADTATGPTADLSIGGWISSEAWAKKNPNTLAAFQRAIVKGQADAASRQVLQQIVPTYTHIDAQTASVMTFGNYPTSVNKTRLQRVLDLMGKYPPKTGPKPDLSKVNVGQLLGESGS